MPASNKVIVTNQSALTAKYGAAGFVKIGAALKKLIAADKARGIATRVVALDVAADMKAAAGIAALPSPTDEPGTKRVIDALFTKIQPDYLVILGAPDVVTHQTLTNPVTDHSANGDPDRTVPSDLPYACEAPYSKNARDFIGPSRVVGRIPDIHHGKDPAYLLSILAQATAATPLAASAYASYFGLTAHVWHKSTALSLDNTFGQSTALLDAPPAAPPYAKSDFGARAHFINCHGASYDTNFYGQTGNSYPVSLDASKIAAVTTGTIVAAECCYGAQLYDPSKTAGQMGIANTYLGGGAHGYLGSTTIAYGPTSGNGSADLVCQYFLQQVLKGSSLGRATLEARQHFVEKSRPLDPVDLKTLAQFILLGDPSVHPVEPPDSGPKGLMPTSKAMFAAARTSSRALRRETLAKRGMALADLTSSAASKPSAAAPSPSIRKALQEAMAELNLGKTTIQTFEVSEKSGKGGRTAKSFGAAAPKKRFHVAIGTPSGDVAVGEKGGGRRERFPVAVVATEVNGALAGIRQLFAR